ncbi:hypothetical protein CDAR_54041 [Caerostris darwini]|uniref:Uncharacterized protein n=1 Tax=Caerostris darwini TaxID=1538125 RepID=A0AAV4WDN2_9ARAC|nr:hypothetical protein CDAR_54041 [Caerostris darwini]
MSSPGTPGVRKRVPYKIKRPDPSGCLGGTIQWYSAAAVSFNLSGWSFVSNFVFPLWTPGWSSNNGKMYVVSEEDWVVIRINEYVQLFEEEWVSRLNLFMLTCFGIMRETDNTYNG